MTDLPVLITGPDDQRAWVRTARAVLADIQAGKLRPGDRLPAVTIAARFGVSLATARRAARELTTTGILARSPGGPLRVPLDAPWRTGPCDPGPQALGTVVPPAPGVRPMMTVSECAGQARLSPMTIYRMTRPAQP
jgi:DNA-binding transcriptional MocR family regulator